MTNLIFSNKFKIVFVLLLQIFSFGASAEYNCVCVSTGRGDYFSDCSHTSQREYFNTSSDCEDFVEKLTRTDFDHKNCYCANSSLWCGTNFERRFKSDRECSTYLGNILNRK
ncbi:MAG: hypothetical protein IPM97_03150 [Bdellovibrionaceae bacterium]|nr:hypothetical protein [Pseudobdellovibrionaceae bacterium]